MEYTERKTTGGNLTIVMEFILLGFSDLPTLQGFLFEIFLVTYMSILIGNCLIIIITMVDAGLQTPTYFCLRNFSFLEIYYTSVTLPRMLTNLWTQKRNISFLACNIQLCFLLILGNSECFLLGVMVYDHYVAICKPLYYAVIMNQRKCFQLLIGSWITGIPVQVALTCQIFSLPFCGSNKLNHVFCDIPPLLKLVCGDTSKNEFSIYADAVLFAMVPFLLIIGSYVKIISTILKLSSPKGRKKAFSTCSSYLIVVGLFYGSGIIMCLRPKSSYSAGTDKVFSPFYTIVTPVFNLLIYSLRNKDVITALKNLLTK